MAHTPVAEGLKAILAAANALNGWPVTLGRLSPTSARSIGVFENGGSPPEVKLAIDYPSVQFLVRGAPAEYVEARDRAQAIFDALQGIDSEPEAWPELTSCVAVGTPIFMGYDQNERPSWSVSFRLIVSREATALRA